LRESLLHKSYESDPRKARLPLERSEADFPCLEVRLEVVADAENSILQNAAIWHYLDMRASAMPKKGIHLALSDPRMG
jgi:hypothetical protein